MLTEAVFRQILERIPSLTVAVLGDLFLDRYLDIDAFLELYSTFWRRDLWEGQPEGRETGWEDTQRHAEGFALLLLYVRQLNALLTLELTLREGGIQQDVCIEIERAIQPGGERGGVGEGQDQGQPGGYELIYAL